MDSQKLGKCVKTITQIENIAAGFSVLLIFSSIILQSQQFSSQIDKFGDIWSFINFAEIPSIF